MKYNIQTLSDPLVVQNFCPMFSFNKIAEKLALGYILLSVLQTCCLGNLIYINIFLHMFLSIVISSNWATRQQKLLSTCKKLGNSLKQISLSSINFPVY